jgi:hypothetical protein
MSIAAVSSAISRRFPKDLMVKVDPRLSRFNFNGINVKWQNPSSPEKSYASKSMADGYDPVNHASWGFDMF